jgi:hypothetical protein
LKTGSGRSRREARRIVCIRDGDVHGARCEQPAVVLHADGEIVPRRTGVGLVGEAGRRHAGAAGGRERRCRKAGEAVVRGRAFQPPGGFVAGIGAGRGEERAEIGGRALGHLEGDSPRLVKFVRTAERRQRERAGIDDVAALVADMRRIDRARLAARICLRRPGRGAGPLEA